MRKSRAEHLQFWDIEADLEGITVADPATDFMYVGTEQPNQIKEFNVATGLVTRSFDLDPWMTGASGSGLEALTFVTIQGTWKAVSSPPACRTGA